MRKLIVKNKIDIIAFLIKAGYSKTKAKQLLKYRAILVDNQPVARHNHLLSPGNTVFIQSLKETSNEIKSCQGLTIIHADDSIIVIDKPAGLLSIATAKEKKRTAYYRLNDCVKEWYGPKERIFIVHRLDRDTSGLLVFARSEIIKHALQNNWKEVEKKYVAVVEGIPREKSRRIVSYLYESKSLRTYAVDKSSNKGKHSVTNYTLLQSAEQHALLEVTLETGRKNQIRVHLADIGHPVAGDKKYGAQTDPCHRMSLHASYLALTHPVTGKRMEFQSRMPGKFHMVFQEKTKKPKHHRDGEDHAHPRHEKKARGKKK